MNHNMQTISKQTVDRYSDRYKKLGNDIKTLGWGNIEQQEYRFLQTIDSNINFEKKSIVDIGCGFGDYYRFLKKYNINISNYLGCDINPDLINEANKINSANIVSYEVKNILETSEEKIADIGVMLGVLNFNLKDTYDNYQYSEQMIKNAFKLVNEVLVVDFLSTQTTKDYPKEDFVFYHDPVKMLRFAFELSNNVVLKHNYAPIPQREFMLFIYKD